MHYKRYPSGPTTNPTNPNLPNRPRPSQLSAALMPPIAVPGHASYPSGHSTQSHLLSGLLAQVMPPAVTQPLPMLAGSPPPAPIPPVLTGKPVPPAPPAATWDTSFLGRLAERVSRNREVLGLHYPSDSFAGVIIAKQSLPLLLQCPILQHTLLPRAQAEWA
jgi:membrane-associated phospholipid phosphatase